MSSDGTERKCPRCGEPAEQLEFVFVDPAAPEKRTFQCKDDDCIQARFYRPVDTEMERPN